MNRKPDVAIAGGRNIAMKVPPHLWDTTVRFYREVIGLEEITRHAPAVGFQFGANQLWIDRVESLSQAELWLELVTDDTRAAAELFEREGIVRRDEIEALPEGFDGYWIQNPASIIHIVASHQDQY